MSEAALKLDVDEAQAALRVHNPSAPAAELKTMAQFVSIAVDVMSAFPERRLRKLAREHKLRAALEQVAQQLMPAETAEGGKVERTRGSGLGELVTITEGRARLDAYATPKPIEEWAGPVGGAGDIETQFGVKRSTLNTWHKQGAVVGLLRGQRKLAYPLEQFIDGRPLQGLADVLGVAPDPRSAWLWLRQPHGALDGQTPLALLRASRTDQVSAIARRDFDREID
ncbi:antitoxin Xre/MbcA/ParS-like domain-containing protein [Rhizorhabdus argentea]|uniref:antitoxin Xre/MbcA/ParS-like domain-containing protein n=1 Tax=Rhizorhabdus argentea TaxID=1387174 RepID=UPI0030EE4A8C